MSRVNEHTNVRMRRNIEGNSIGNDGEINNYKKLLHAFEHNNRTKQLVAANQVNNEMVENEQAQNEQAKNEQAKNEQATNNQPKNDQPKNDQPKNAQAIENKLKAYENFLKNDICDGVEKCYKEFLGSDRIKKILDEKAYHRWQLAHRKVEGLIDIFKQKLSGYEDDVTQATPGSNDTCIELETVCEIVTFCLPPPTDPSSNKSTKEPPKKQEKKDYIVPTLTNPIPTSTPSLKEAMAQINKIYEETKTQIKEAYSNKENVTKEDVEIVEKIYNASLANLKTFYNSLDPSLKKQIDSGKIINKLKALKRKSKIIENTNGKELKKILEDILKETNAIVEPFHKQLAILTDDEGEDLRTKLNEIVDLKKEEAKYEYGEANSESKKQVNIRRILEKLEKLKKKPMQKPERPSPSNVDKTTSLDDFKKIVDMFYNDTERNVHLLMNQLTPALKNQTDNVERIMEDVNDMLDLGVDTVKKCYDDANEVVRGQFNLEAAEDKYEELRRKAEGQKNSVLGTGDGGEDYHDLQNEIGLEKVSVIFTDDGGKIVK